MFPPQATHFRTALLASAALLLTCFTSHAQNLSSIAVSPSSVDGGTSTTGTVTLEANARAAVQVSLYSSHTAVATVTTPVTVPAGANSANFTINTKPVAANTNVTIRASYRGIAKTAPLEVRAPVLFSVYFNQGSPVTGGTAFTGTVLISGPAPTGGVKVALASDKPGLQVPADVTVPAGATTGIFPVTTSPVGVNTVATVSATLKDRVRTREITLIPAALNFFGTSLTNPVGGTTVIGTIQFNGLVAGTTARVDVTSSNAAAVVPARVSIPVGQDSVDFNFATRPVTVDTPVTISASYKGVTKTKVITVKAPTLNAAFVNGPDEVTGGTATDGIVQINGLAPAGGVAINLASNNAAATVPATVTIPAGQTKVGFAITTKPVASNTVVTLTASQGTITRTDTLTVFPPALIGVPLASYYITGGSSTTGTVRLNAPAPTGGTRVALSSSNAAATVPTSVLVPAGADEAIFTVNSSRVTANTRIDITATLNGATRTSSITLAPAGGLTAPSGSGS